MARSPPPSYLRWEGEFVELHHPVHVLCGRGRVTTGTQRGSSRWSPPSPPPTGLTVMAPGHEDVLEPTVRLVHAKLRAARGDGRGGAQEQDPEGGGGRGTTAREGKGAAPVQGVLEVRVGLEGAVTEDHRGLGTAADWEGVSDDCPLGTDGWAALGGRNWPDPQVGVQSLERRLPRALPC